MRIKFLDKMKSELYRARLAVFVVFAFCMGAVFAFLATSNTKNTNATTAGFKAGNIMTDYVMSNSNTMSVSDIQNFLTRKNPCNYRDYNKYVSLMNSNAAKNKGYRWHWDNGHFVCLSEERFDGQSAAQIIYDAAQDYHINPQVLIVLLEKEQGLITDKYPNNIQYRSATGYGCPDTAACNTKYYGFKNQVRNAAALFHQVLTGGWSNYHVGNNQVAYHPNAACGRSNVYIENLATAALYRYTPYQPNSAALSWSGDGCSSYGNRNFYHYFTEWFGSTQQDVPIANYQVIPDGEYRIASALTYDNLLTADGNGNGANAKMYTRNDSQKNQRWKVQYHQDDHSYTFINVATGKVLDLYNASTKSGTNVQLYDSNNSCAQRWNIIVNDDGSKTLVSSCSRMVSLDIDNGSKNSGANVQIYTSNNTAAQKWHFIADPTVKEGVYELVSGTNGELRLDIFGGLQNVNNGTNVQVHNKNGTAAQKWQIKYDAREGVYMITNPHNELSLDVQGGGINNGTNVQVYNKNGTAAQKWQILSQGDGYIIVSAKSGRVLDVYDGSKNSGANVQIYTSNNTAAQKWHFKETSTKQEVADGVYEIVAGTNTEKALDVYGGSSAAKNGTNVQIYERNKTDAQRWQITYDKSSDTYLIVNTTSNLSLDVYNGSTSNNANVQVYSQNKTNAQRWRIIESDGSFTILSVGSGLSLDVFNAGAHNGANVQQYTTNNTAAQKWQLIRIQ